MEKFGLVLPEAERPPFGMPVGGPALPVRGQLEDIGPADRRLGPPDRLGHGLGHGDDQGRQHERLALAAIGSLPCSVRRWSTIAPHPLEAGDQMTGFGPSASSFQPSTSNDAPSPDDFEYGTTFTHESSTCARSELVERLREVGQQLELLRRHRHVDRCAAFARALVLAPDQPYDQEETQGSDRRRDQAAPSAPRAVVGRLPSPDLAGIRGYPRRHPRHLSCGWILHRSLWLDARPARSLERGLVLLHRGGLHRRRRIRRDGGGIDRGAFSVRNGERASISPWMSRLKPEWVRPMACRRASGLSGAGSCSAVGMDALSTSTGMTRRPLLERLADLEGDEVTVEVEAPSTLTVDRVEPPLADHHQHHVGRRDVPLDDLEEVLPEVEGVDVHEDALRAERLLQVLPDSSRPRRRVLPAVADEDPTHVAPFS